MKQQIQQMQKTSMPLKAPRSIKINTPKNLPAKSIKNLPRMGMSAGMTGVAKAVKKAFSRINK